MIAVFRRRVQRKEFTWLTGCVVVICKGGTPAAGDYRLRNVKSSIDEKTVSD